MTSSARATAPTSRTCSCAGSVPAAWRASAPGAAAPASGGGSGGGPKPDKTPPRISGARLTHARFSVANARTAVVAGARAVRHAHAPRGTSFVFSLSERASTTIAIVRRADGRRSGGRCVAPRPGLKRRCTRTVAVLTLIRGRTARGRNSVPIQRACRTDDPEARALRRPDRRARCLREPLDPGEPGVDGRGAALTCTRLATAGSSPFRCLS